ncbi:hybrid sensor histidine kinase/response regulator [Stappia taiwanensis]|uniref:histidine kinase n=1 Tax=Stappia taiwanensis TaxID=992267 RepID=A0A838XYM0_9HYPH|nr:PAS domain-containing hybrid sensor histidine kinase/response regulator [Stappia taiwanensis]MBA4612124.1 hybrid sensor histidine kinase/response regulator [Stappia taiwanensis]GGE93455.1 histidine kinase [Stappia taiwanensis]
MLQGWVVVFAALGYILLLFAIASYGDRRARPMIPGKGRPLIYALSLSVYCTSWTFFGSVGTATYSGLEFLTIYVGPMLVFALGYPLLRRIIRLAKSERITSIADFIGARYGKSQSVAAVVAIIAVVGVIPYIALQLKAVSLSITTMIAQIDLEHGGPDLPYFNDITLIIAIGMAVFAWLFGTRHIDATEHQEGLMLAIAAEAVVKLVAFLTVGIWVTFWLYDGPGALSEAVAAHPEVTAAMSSELSGGNWLVMTLLSACAILMLPRQFHVTVTENNSSSELRRATWLFPLYLVAINLFVMPIAAAGMILLDPSANPDSYVLALPIAADHPWLALFAFLGGLSAATAMVIVAAVALAIMISNDLVMPLVLRRSSEDAIISSSGEDMSQILLLTRRAAIFVTMLLSYAYFRAAGDTAALTSIGLLSFAAIAQFAPAFFGGLIWRGATARGAIAGMLSGFALWLYTLLLPTFAQSGLIPDAILNDGPFGIWLLRPEALFSLSFDPLTHGVFWSLSVNLVVFVLVSLARAPEPLERLQANIFVPSELSPTPVLRLWRTSVTVGDLRSTIARYLGEERTDRSFQRFARERGLQTDMTAPADAQILRFSEQILASAIGAASSRLVLSLLIKRRDPTGKGAMKLLDDATVAIQYNRDLLQTALDQVRQGIAVYDRDLRLICWNRQFRELLGLPAEYGQVGTPLDAIIRYNAKRGEYGNAPVETIVADRIDKLAVRQRTFQEQMGSSATVLEVRTNPMPGGGIVTTYTDITERVLAEEALARANETLEKRVRERTQELTRVNEELSLAKGEAEEANLGKTRFIAAAGHDILQPLNAARLYASSLTERFSDGESRDLAENVSSSLESVEEIIGAILDISRLDAGVLKPEVSVFRLDEILNPLRMEFEPIAREKALDLRILPSSVSVRSDRRLLRRLLQNLVSNAIKYTRTGRVLVGVRRRAGRICVEVIDTGIGIPEEKLQAVFQEFQRLDDGAREARGLGLGLAIVQRIARVLDHPVSLRSIAGTGTRFHVDLPAAAALPARAAAPAPRAPASSLQGLHVMAIDNEPQILDGMRVLLSGWQCRVTTAHDPREAERKACESGDTPDVLIVDYHLDEGTGVEAVVQLRWKFDTHLPAILITADRTQAVRAEAEAKGIELLNKPVKPAALRALLSRLRGKPAQMPATAADLTSDQATV